MASTVPLAAQTDDDTRRARFSVEPVSPRDPTRPFIAILVDDALKAKLAELGVTTLHGGPFNLPHQTLFEPPAV